MSHFFSQWDTSRREVVTGDFRRSTILERPSRKYRVSLLQCADFWDTCGVSMREITVPTGQILGYARVSTSRQTIDQQVDALVTVGVRRDRIYSDTMSGKRDDRPGLADLLTYARAGDTIVVVALDRLGRSLSGIIRTLGTLTERDILLRSLREGIDTSSATGRMIAGIFASLAEYEHGLILERANAAREAAAARGKQTGRPRTVSPDQVRQARRLREAGESMADIVAALRVSRSTLYRALSESGE